MCTHISHLSRLLERAVARKPSGAAVEDEYGNIHSYAELFRAADRVSTRLARWGVGRGDRVGIYLPKSFESVAAIHAVLRAGAAYVPIDPTAPPIRAASILAGAAVKAAVIDQSLVPSLKRAWPGPGPLPRLIAVDRGETLDLAEENSAIDASWNDVLDDDAPSPLEPPRLKEDPAYILFTSGSTGRPKGVMLSHENAFTFLDWCEETLGLEDDDRFGSHAPFHFDLSVFDLFASARRAAPIVLAGESLGKDPARLGPYLAERRVSVWYSAPSILAMLAERGGLDRLEEYRPRLVLFAGEVFPLAPLKRLRELWSTSEIWNLYGPTETNVCTAFRIPDSIPEERSEPFPIGRVCPPMLAKVVDEFGRETPAGVSGELLISGPGVMLGYFGMPETTAAAFQTDDDGRNWYRTGDVVVADEQGCLIFRGRRDRMIKKRGYRIELGEIESALHRHEGIAQAAVIARPTQEGALIDAFVSLKPSYKRSIIEMKRHCATYLPAYMIPDTFTFLPALPATSTDKIDYASLKRISDSSARSLGSNDAA